MASTLNTLSLLPSCGFIHGRSGEIFRILPFCHYLSAARSLKSNKICNVQSLDQLPSGKQ